VVGEVIDIARTANGETWAVALTDLPRSMFDDPEEPWHYSLAGVGDISLSNRQRCTDTIIREISLVEYPAASVPPVSWQPLDITRDRGGYRIGTGVLERQVLDHVNANTRARDRRGYIEVGHLPPLHAPAMTRTAPVPTSSLPSRQGSYFGPIDPMTGKLAPMPVKIDKNGIEWRTRYCGQITRIG
jgi:hypothetical protein